VISGIGCWGCSRCRGRLISAITNETAAVEWSSHAPAPAAFLLDLGIGAIAQVVVQIIPLLRGYLRPEPKTRR
jgi:hypothetical protein